MKPHLRVTLREPVSASLPGWQAVIRRGVAAPERLVPGIDQLMARYGLQFIATQEFEPQSRYWQSDEIAAGLNRIYRLILRDNRDTPELLIRQIEMVPQVVSVQPVQIGVAELPRPTALSRRTDRDSRDVIFLPQAHRFTKGSPEVTIAVLDTGVDTDHPELAHALLPGMDFVDIIDGASDFIGDFLGVDTDPSDAVGHGTHVSGIIAAKGIAMPMGVAPRCKILPVRVLAAMQEGERRVGAGIIPNIDAGIKFAVDKGVDVINMSLGVRHESGGLPHREVIEYATRKGVTLVAASGNDGQEQLYYPGAYPEVIAVGAMGREQPVAAFSTFGRQVTIIAPGEDIYSTSMDDQYAFSSGTSHAAPFVSGGVALLKSYAAARGRRLSDGQVKYLLKQSSDKVDQRFKHRKAGYGRLNLADALRLLDFKLSA